MNIIALETSTTCCSVALVTDLGEVEKTVTSAKGHASLLAKMLDSLLSEMRLRKDEIDWVAFGSGPGSFNGVRAAAAFAHGISIANKIPITAISTLQALAFAGLSSQAKYILAIMDARQNEIYYAAYSAHNAQLNSLLQPEHNLAKPQDIFNPEGTGWVLTACNWDAYVDDLPPKIRALVRIGTNQPSALSVAKLAKASQGENTSKLLKDAMPVYLRHPVKHQKMK